MKKIIAYSKQSDAKDHTDYEWFRRYGEDLMRDGKPCLVRFADDDNNDYDLTEPYYDCDNDVMLALFRSQDDLDETDWCDYDYLTTMESITFLFDDGTTKTFETDDGRDIRRHFDEDAEKPTDVYAELVQFLMNYIKNGGYQDQELYAIIDDVFEDI